MAIMKILKKIVLFLFVIFYGGYAHAAWVDSAAGTITYVRTYAIPGTAVVRTEIGSYYCYA